MEILESARFAKLADDYLGDEDLQELKLTLAINNMPKQIWLLTIYAKNEMEKIPAATLKKWKQGIES
jgi:hypothetical protein